MAEKKRLGLVKKIIQEMDQMAEDMKVAPYIFYQGSRMFFEWAYPGQNPEKFVDYPSNFELKEFEKEYLGILVSIDILKHRYPSIYEKFKAEWVKIQKKCRKSLNEKQLSLFENQIDTGRNSDYRKLESGQIVNKKKVGRNDPCPCGSGKKYKKCCM